MTIKKHFSNHAQDYDNNNIIQRIVSKALVREVQNNPKNILELGCGSGQIYREISWHLNKYKAIDFSQGMCDIHPANENLEVKCFDFDSEVFWEDIKNDKFDLVISSSAMQWSKDLNLLLKRLFTITNKIDCVLFTSNTFKSIYEITKQKPAILSKEEIIKEFDNYQSTYETINYQIKFDSKKELFSYIKNSGVQGDVKLSYKDAKNLYKKYDKLYLEFEVIFVKAKVSS